MTHHNRPAPWTWTAFPGCLTAEALALNRYRRFEKVSSSTMNPMASDMSITGPPAWQPDHPDSPILRNLSIGFAA